MTRIIPCLLLNGTGFFKTTKFKDPVYLGDPLNILKIFNEKEVDEVAVLDISATVQNKGPNFTYLQDLASECFMPLAYGGGVKSVEQVQRLFQIGFEKVILNSHALQRPQLIREVADVFGSQSIVVSIDVKKGVLGRMHVCSHGGRQQHRQSPEAWARQAAELGAGEIIINSINRDGTMTGYDLELIRSITSEVSVPVIALGGARNVADFSAAVHEAHASACAAGAMFVFQGPHRAVLINVPPAREIERALARVTS
jgi:imidazole glycerol-phosphate synthase subunit HisF